MATNIGNIPTANGRFGSDTIIQLPNASNNNVNAAEWITSLIDTTAASEDAQLVINLITAGTAATAAQTITGLGTKFPAGAFTTPGVQISTARGFFDDGTYLRVKTNGRAHYWGDTFLALDPAAASAGYYVDLNLNTGIVLDTAMTGGSGLKFVGAANIGMRVNAVGISFLGVTAPVAAQTSGANLTNSVTSGGVNDTITDWTNLTTYSTDAAAIRNAVYQLARKVKQVNDGLRAFGLLT